jgi:16S rRNA G966 N2-methylase RsmD
MSSSKLKYLFGDLQLEFPEAYLSFVTPKNVSDTIIQLAQEHFDLTDKIIWDIFAGIGTDSIRFADVSNKVYCTELNENTYKVLCKNTSNKDNIMCRNIDSTTCINMHPYDQCDIVYFDPPWGSTYDKSATEFDFNNVKINNLTVPQLALQLHSQADLIIKSPVISNSFEDIFGSNIDTFLFTQQKLKFLFVRK